YPNPTGAIPSSCLQTAGGEARVRQRDRRYLCVLALTVSATAAEPAAAAPCAGPLFTANGVQCELSGTTVIVAANATGLSTRNTGQFTGSGLTVNLSGANAVGAS